MASWLDGVINYCEQLLITSSTICVVLNFNNFSFGRCVWKKHHLIEIYLDFSKEMGKLWYILPKTPPNIWKQQVYVKQDGAAAK
jgi:hypothetical protein